MRSLIYHRPQSDHLVKKSSCYVWQQSFILNDLNSSVMVGQYKIGIRDHLIRKYVLKDRRALGQPSEVLF